MPQMKLDNSPKGQRQIIRSRSDDIPSYPSDPHDKIDHFQTIGSSNANKLSQKSDSTKHPELEGHSRHKPLRSDPIDMAETYYDDLHYSVPTASVQRPRMVDVGVLDQFDRKFHFKDQTPRPDYVRTPRTERTPQGGTGDMWWGQNAS